MSSSAEEEEEAGDHFRQVLTTRVSSDDWGSDMLVAMFEARVSEVAVLCTSQFSDKFDMGGESHRLHINSHVQVLVYISFTLNGGGSVEIAKVLQP